MKKLLIVVLALAMVFGLAACGEGGKDVTATPAEIEAKIKEALGEGYICDVEMSADELAITYGLDMSKVEEFVSVANAIPSVNLDKVTILRVADGYAEQATAMLNAAYAQYVSYTRMYPFNAAKVLNARIFQSGNYVALIIAGASPDIGATAEQEAKLAADEYAKIDAVWQEFFGSANNIAVVPEDSGHSGGLLGGANLG